VIPDGDGARIPDMARLVELNGGLRFGARPGLLGASGVSCVTAVGQGAALAAADRSGAVSRYIAELPADPAPLLARCPLTLVDLGALPDDGERRTAALRALDASVAAIEAGRADGTTLMVIGLAEAQSGQPHLHPAVIEGPGFRGGWLWSKSTRRAPYVQLSDMAPTALAEVGARPPTRIAGERLVARTGDRPAALRDTLDVLRDTDTAAVEQRGVLVGFYVIFGVVSLLVYGPLLWLLRRRRLGGPRGGATVRRLGVGAIALAAVPAATFCANLVPWWRASVPLLALTSAVLVAVVLTVAIAYLGPWRRHPSGPAAAVALVTVVVFILDALTGTNLQLNSMLGYNPLVAGRFFGFGNIAAAPFGAAALMLAAFLAEGRPRRQALTVVAAVAVPTIAVDGAPGWGADFGGVLTFVPAFAILALLVTRSRVSVLRFALAAGAGVLVVALIGVADYFRAEPSHFGRFVAAVLDGSAGETVDRKLRTSLDLLLKGPHTVAALILVVFLGVLVFRPPATLREAYAKVPALRVALVAVVVMSVLGGLTNDSSVAIPLIAALFALPVTLAVCVRAHTRPRPTKPDTPVPGMNDRAQVLP
jgi:hypothetical protein